jgi:SpoVK/Ycf46/Vps4 family AAA+-type ATPase
MKGLAPALDLFFTFSVKSKHMASPEYLLKLFQAVGEHNETALHKVADAIIAEEAAANHHALANDLRKALNRASGKSSPRLNGFAALPKDRRNGEELLTLRASNVDRTRVFLHPKTEKQINRILDEHRKKKRLQEHGYHPKSRLLFWGPPGCGKTLTAHLLAYELGLPVALLRLSSVISSFLGDTTAHLQRVFDLAASKPMVLLLDEVDALGKNRDDRNDVGELKRIVNGLLQCMDSFQSSDSIVIAATNHQYLLDPALWRRFDDLVHFPLPLADQRKSLLQRLLSGVQFDGSLSTFVKKTERLSFADIERIVIEAVKGMLLAERSVLEGGELLVQLHSVIENLAYAKKRSPRSSDES